jgi:uncharacterized spore protein YtfJ
MSLERMFSSIESLRATSAVSAAFGEPQEVEGKVLIPVATVKNGFGLGFGEGTSGEVSETDECQRPAEGEGGGAAAGATARPIAVIEVTPEDTVIRPITDETKVALAGIALVAWIAFWIAATVRAVFGHRP